MNVEFHSNFKKRYKKLNSSLQKNVDKRLILFRKEPLHTLLNNHSLRGKYLGYRSINVTGDYRAIYSLKTDDIAFFVAIDNHSNLYK